VSDRIVAWAGGGAVYDLNLDTRVWTRHLPLNAPNPGGDPTAAGWNGARWQYVPSKNVFVVVNDIDDSTYFYKLPKITRRDLNLNQWTGIKSPTVTSSVPSGHARTEAASTFASHTTRRPRLRSGSAGTIPTNSGQFWRELPVGVQRGDERLDKEVRAMRGSGWRHGTRGPRRGWLPLRLDPKRLLAFRGLHAECGCVQHIRWHHAKKTP